jgi:hypothetical protein
VNRLFVIWIGIAAFFIVAVLVKSYLEAQAVKPDDSVIDPMFKKTPRN